VCAHAHAQANVHECVYICVFVSALCIYKRMDVKIDVCALEWAPLYFHLAGLAVAKHDPLVIGGEAA